MAARMSTPIDDPISSSISWAKAGVPESVIVMPGGGFERATMSLMLLSTSSCRSLEIAGWRLTTLIVIIREGM